MGQKIKTRVIVCPLQKRAVEVTYTMLGPWYKRELDVLSCPAISDSGGNCYRQCKSLLTWNPGLGDSYFGQWQA
jgi:hypothetical protein